SDMKEPSIVITDMQGKKVLQRSWTSSPNESGQIDMSGFPKGLYFVRIITEKESRVRKLVIE
ncbi:MAG: T9SS type A sorting domain-containing protein, partial [Bacteroidota bacterium]